MLDDIHIYVTHHPRRSRAQNILDFAYTRIYIYIYILVNLLFIISIFGFSFDIYSVRFSSTFFN